MSRVFANLENDAPTNIGHAPALSCSSRRKQLDELFLQTAKHIRSDSEIIVLTGAGLSAEAGLPTLSDLQAFKEWNDFDYLSLEGFQRDPTGAWKFYDAARCAIAAVQPSPSHQYLVALQERIPKLSIATHNVDGLHQKAGSPQVLELSGSIWRLRCENDLYSTTDYSVPLPRVPPVCACGSIMRPNVVLFGENLDSEAYRHLLYRINRRSGVVLVLGLSCRNSTMTALINELQINRWVIIEVNPNETSLSQLADVSIRTTASIALRRLI
jgi:NAD-dependent deacetylase